MPDHKPTAMDADCFGNVLVNGCPVDYRYVTGPWQHTSTYNPQALATLDVIAANMERLRQVLEG